MSTKFEIAKNTFSAMDKSMFEIIFFNVNKQGVVEMSNFLLIGIFLTSTIMLGMFFDRNNTYTRGHHARQRAAFTLSLIIIFGINYMISPDFSKTEKELQKRLEAKIAQNLTVQKH